MAQTLAESAVPDWATDLDTKRSLFDDDTYYLECRDDLRSVFSPARLRAYCEQTSFLLVKPEALLTGRLPAIVDWLRDRGWLIGASRPVPANRHLPRGLWRYHWNAVTSQHRAVVDLLFAPCPALLLLVRHRDGWDVPATAALAAQKGPSKPHRRQSGQLRAELGDYNGYLNFVHSPDEPADLIRELGVLLPATERIAMIEESVTSCSVPVSPNNAGGHIEWDALSRAHSLSRLDTLCGRYGDAGRQTSELLHAAVRRADAREWDGDWLPLRTALAALDPVIVTDFAFAVFATYLTTPDAYGKIRRIPTIRDGTVETG
jgi:hypothetical protein